MTKGGYSPWLWLGSFFQLQKAVTPAVELIWRKLNREKSGRFLRAMLREDLRRKTCVLEVLKDLKGFKWCYRQSWRWSFGISCFQRWISGKTYYKSYLKGKWLPSWSSDISIRETVEAETGPHLLRIITNHQEDFKKKLLRFHQMWDPICIIEFNIPLENDSLH